LCQISVSRPNADSLSCTPWSRAPGAGFQPDKGDELWQAEGVHRYVCPSVVANKGVVFAIGGGLVATYVAQYHPGLFLALPRERPETYFSIMLL